MASGWTNRGKYNCLGVWWGETTIETNYYVALITDAVAPGPDIDEMTSLTEIAAGNGYTSGGDSITPGTDTDGWTESDASDYAAIQLTDVVWTATGNLPSSGDGASYAVLTDDDGTVANRDVYVYWDLVSARSVTNGQTLTLQDCEVRLTE